MPNDFQESVTCKVPCRFKDGSFSIWGGSATEVRGMLLLDFGSVKLSVGPSREAVHLRNRMVEAKRKRCGKFRVVLEFPAYETKIGSIGDFASNRRGK